MKGDQSHETEGQGHGTGGRGRVNGGEAGIEIGGTVRRGKGNFINF